MYPWWRGVGGRLQRLVQHRGNLLRQTQLVLLVLGLHCTAVQGAHSNFCLRRKGDAELICRGGTNYAKNDCFVRGLQIELEREL